MTALARLKPDPVAPDLERLGALVLAVEARLRAPGLSRQWDPAQKLWPELTALCQSIAEDDGWHLSATNPGKAWERQFLFLDAPQVFLFSSHLAVSTRSAQAPVRWLPAPVSMVDDAKRARRKRLGAEIPLYNDDVKMDMRARQSQRWGWP